MQTTKNGHMDKYCVALEGNEAFVWKISLIRIEGVSHLSKVLLRRIWGAVMGGFFGAVFGWAYITWRIVTKRGIPSFIGTGAGAHRMIIEFPAVEFSIVLFSVLGFFMVYGLSTSQRICHGCNQENPHGAKMCQFCGEGFDMIETEMICPSCDNHYANGAKFCPMCAVELKTPAELRKEVMAKNPPITKECSACGAINLPQRSACHQCEHPV